MKFDRQAARDMLARIPDDEPVFVLRAQDKCANWAIQAWLTAAVLISVSAEKRAGALSHLNAFMEWQATHETKVPD